MPLINFDIEKTQQQNSDDPVQLSELKKSADYLQQAYAQVAQVSQQVNQEEQQQKRLFNTDSFTQDQGSEKLANQLQHLLSILPSGVIILDGQGVITQCNTVAFQLLGSPLINQKWIQVVKRAFKPQLDDGHEVSLVNGRKVRVETRALDFEPGQLILLTDLTETRNLQRQLAQNDRLAYLGRMMASLAHQIRTPLSAAMLHAANLNNDNISHEQIKKFSHRLQQRLRLVERQVNDMLMFVRNGKSSEDIFDWRDVLQSVKELTEATIGYRKIELSTNPLPESVLLYGARDDMVGAIQNITENAVQALASVENGNLTIQSEVQQDELTVAIKDNGCGMERSQVEQIFEPFYTSKSRGTGLGLAISKKVIENHGGSISVSSELKKGSCFTIVLPLASHVIGGKHTSSERAHHQEVCHE